MNCRLLFLTPIFVALKDDVHTRAVAIMRKALNETEPVGIGENAFSGREHLVALAAPGDPKQKGLMLYTLRYEEELRSAKEYVSSIKNVPVDSNSLRSLGR
jgi:DNA end-binding protein Ku